MITDFEDLRYERMLDKELKAKRAVSLVSFHPKFGEVCWLMGVASQHHPCCMAYPDMSYVREVAWRYLIAWDVPWEDARQAILDGHYNPVDPKVPKHFKRRSRRDVKRLLDYIVKSARIRMEGQYDAKTRMEKQ